MDRKSKDRQAGPERRNPVSAKLVEKMRKGVSVKAAKLRRLISGCAVHKQVVTEGELADFHPAHAAYVYTQNQVSALSVQLTALPEMGPWRDIISAAEDLYLPSGPPMSPLTVSYFTCWAFFDVCAGPLNETIGSILGEAGAAFGMHTQLLRLIQLMQESRMGFYVQQGVEGGLVILEDIVTGCVLRALSPAGYLGAKGEIWYARVLPPAPLSGYSEHVVFTTPYLVLQPGMLDWLAYFSRTFASNPQARIEDYERHMKYGPTRAYWNDFVFEAYVNHRQEVIYLAGLPDVPGSRPHSGANDWGFRQ